MATKKEPKCVKISSETGYPVLCQFWVESERGWGQSADGYSLHLDKDDLNAYVKDYTKDRTGPVPEVYDRPSGDPIEIFVSKRVKDQIVKSANGIRCWDGSPKAGKLLK